MHYLTDQALEVDRAVGERERVARDQQILLGSGLDRNELIAHAHTVDEIRDQIGADSLGYLSIEGLRALAAKELKRGICDGCFSNEYPVEIDATQTVPQLSLFRSINEEETPF